MNTTTLWEQAEARSVEVAKGVAARLDLHRTTEADGSTSWDGIVNGAHVSIGVDYSRSGEPTVTLNWSVSDGVYGDCWPIDTPTSEITDSVVAALRSACGSA